jgi:hypothetical protein
MMRLSEAIRLGAMLGPQVFGSTFSAEGSCAFGAAVLAAQCPTFATGPFDTHRSLRDSDAGSGYVAAVPNEWNWIMETEAPCPVCGTVQPGYRQIAHLNDDHRWTRDAIADFVAERELAREAPAGECQEASHGV